ncbi:IclR family transcriptional regulator [Lysinibacillus parviboronicapiens]|uniref:IclR family KDG regulon transcriptional repressor n=1 Tax=Lysinibacillus parviboronicapiens TaxID=436516 RepID=A0ABV2PPJ7_9BACI|nr:IclR family transcriptional regulator [Lysinibacillus parviboronicapiens]
MNSYEVSTLKKGLLILDLLREKHALTLTEIMEELSMNKTSVFRMLYTLEKMNYVTKHNKYYHLNSHIFRNEHLYWHHDIQWASLIAPYHLARQEQITTYIGILEDCEMVIKNVIREPFEQPAFHAIDSRTPMHSSALGKVVLAHLSPDRQQAMLNNMELHTYTTETFYDYGLLIPHLQVIKAQGYAVDNEETNLGKCCIAVPIYLNKEAIGAIAFHGTTEQIKKNAIRSYVKKLVEASQQMTVEINYLLD